MNQRRPSFTHVAMLSGAMLFGCRSGGNRITGGGISPNFVDEMRVPKNAEVAIQGRGPLNHTFRRDGRMWLYDATAEKTLLTIPVQRGQRFIIDPTDDRAAQDGQDVFGGDMQLRNEHQIYNLPKR
ncbi:MAG TPA: hypothetical protein VGR35_15715 [Tepidisphaeraceae bacterium]|nr:hypothetical protein [Tepidisphaeraceae bacterium]